MPRIELVLPGEKVDEVLPSAESYRITVERMDGKACTELEARTIISLSNLQSARDRENGRDKPKH